MMGIVLIAEDDIALAQIKESFLSRNGFASTYTSTVKDAIFFLQKQSVDLFLLDYRLPDGTGPDLLQTIRMKNQTVPVVIMTGFNDLRTAVRAMKMGAADYIIKPVNPDELLMILRQALEQARQENVSRSDKGKGEKFVKGELI